MTNDDTKEVQQQVEETEVEKLTKERDEYLDGWKRAKADLANYKKEEAERMEQFVRYSTQAVIADLVTVLDSFDLGLSVIKEDDPARKGVILIKSQLEDILKRYGLERIETKKGEAFDPSIHEAVETVESEAPPGTIVDELSPGYRLQGKVIRPARVNVSKQKGQDK
ncbi:nucleotide exchange factor GrpE [Patescibacteria group bacterium]|jgi:molecular chaperone GrpE|nr:nucleotide exchange factor GrpE [Patescibacteria group bacterium]MCL5114708.1 nucleotide exchange factor GrpE [Patescibacteria group bacterium]